MTIDRTQRDAFIEWARGARLPLAGVDPDLGEEDLTALAPIIGDAHIVGIGESWHSACELLMLKHRLSRFLIERLGFSMLVFEGGMPGSPIIDSFVAGGAGTAVDALKALGQPMWLNGETVQLLEWVRAHNAAQPDARKVRVFGVDPAYPAGALEAVPAYLAKIDPDYAVPHEELLRTVARAMRAVPLSSSAKSAVWGATDAYEALDPESRSRFRSCLSEIAGWLLRHEAQYSARSSNAEFGWALRQVTVALQAYDIISVRTRSLGEANYARDLAFAENIAWLRGRFPERRMIVFAHNMHVARDPFRSAPGGPDIASMAGHLDAWYGDDYFAIGTAVGRSRLSNGNAAVTGVPETVDDGKRAFIEGTTDVALEQVGEAQFLLRTDADIAWLREPQATRSHLEPQPRYTPATAFDVIAYIDHLGRGTPVA